MIHRLYNQWHITNSGEKETDKQLSIQTRNELFYAIHHMRISSRYHATQSAGECDFVILTRLGLMAMEVKGGEMGYGRRPDESTGFYRLLNGRGGIAIIRHK